MQLPVAVPDPSGDSLQVSGIAIGLSGQAAPALNAASIAPVVPFQPTTTRTFSAGQTLRVFGRAFWRGKAAAQVTVGIEGVPATAQQPALAVSEAPRGGQQGAFDVTVPLGGLAPGSYVLAISARAGQNAVVRQIAFTAR